MHRHIGYTQTPLFAGFLSFSLCLLSFQCHKRWECEWSVEHPRSATGASGRIQLPAQACLKSPEFSESKIPPKGRRSNCALIPPVRAGIITAPAKRRELEADPHQYEPSVELGVTHTALGATGLLQGQRDKNHRRSKEQEHGAVRDPQPAPSKRLINGQTGMEART